MTIDYLPDPKGKTDAWIAPNRLSCAPGAGTTVTPNHALLRAEGTDAATGAFGTVPSRKLEATYIFRIDNRCPAARSTSTRRRAAATSAWTPAPPTPRAARAWS